MESILKKGNIKFSANDVFLFTHTVACQCMKGQIRDMTSKRNKRLQNYEI
jgi:hypothetical protein